MVRTLITIQQVSDFIHISDDAYSREMLLIMEKSILGKLYWSLTVPTLYVFLARYIMAAISDQEMESMVFFLAELRLSVPSAKEIVCLKLGGACSIVGVLGEPG